MPDTTATARINYKSIWVIAYPIIIGSIAQNIIQLTDTAFLGHLSTTALGAVAIGGLFYFVGIMMLWGLSIGTQIIIARRLGEKALKEIGKTFRYALYIQIVMALMLLVFFQLFGQRIFHFFIQSENVYTESIHYLNYRSWGILFSGINLIFRAFYVGITRTRIIGTSTFMMAVINIFFNYVLIFGKWGFPFMGIEGAALASVIAESFTTVVFIIYTKLKIPLQTYGFFQPMKLYDRQYLLHIIRISFPMMIQLNLSLLSWFLFFLLVEKMGELELAASNIIRSLYLFLMMPVWGFASTANTLTSQLIGRKKEHHIFPMLWKCITLNLVMVTCVVVIGLIFAEYLLALYTTDVDVLTASLPVFYVICMAAIFMAVSWTLFQAVSGTGKTIMALYIEIITLSFYLLFAYLMVYIFNQSLTLAWTADILYGVLIGLCSFLYLRFGKWSQKLH